MLSRPWIQNRDTIRCKCLAPLEQANGSLNLKSFNLGFPHKKTLYGAMGYKDLEKRF